MISMISSINRYKTVKRVDRVAGGVFCMGQQGLASLRRCHLNQNEGREQEVGEYDRRVFQVEGTERL